MKNSKMFFFYLAICLFFLTSCQKNVDFVKGDDNISKEESQILVSKKESLPKDMPTPEELLVISNNPIEVNEKINFSACPKNIIWWNTAEVHFQSSPQYALWIYQYDDMDNYLGTTRHDVLQCGPETRSYDAPEDACKFLMFVGYQYWGVVEFDICYI